MKVFKSTDKKELFNLAYIGVLTQGKQSQNPYPSVTCAYKTTDSDNNVLMCGIGHCLTDEAMAISARCGSVIYTLLERLAEDHNVKDMPDAGHMDFLSELQGNHDLSDAYSTGPKTDAEFIELFIAAMKKFAVDQFGANCKFDPKLGLV